MEYPSWIYQFDAKSYDGNMFNTLCKKETAEPSRGEKLPNEIVFGCKYIGEKHLIQMFLMRFWFKCFFVQRSIHKQAHAYFI